MSRFSLSLHRSGSGRRISFIKGSLGCAHDHSEEDVGSRREDRLAECFEGLVISRAGAAGPGDELVLIEQRGKLDVTYVEDWIVQFADVLESPQMLAHYRRLVKAQGA